MTAHDLKQRRLALGLSQKQLAEALGVSASTVAHWEQDKQGIPAYLDLALQTVERQALTADDESDLQRIVEEMAPDEEIALAVIWKRKPDGSAVPAYVTLDLREAKNFAKGARGWVETYMIPKPADKT